jgi:hypothetical protein
LSTKDDEYALLVADLGVLTHTIWSWKLYIFKRTWLVPMLHLPCYNASSDSVRYIIHLWSNSILSSVLLSAITLILGLIVFWFVFQVEQLVTWKESNPHRVTLVPLPYLSHVVSSLRSSHWIPQVGFLHGRSYGRSRITPQLLILYTWSFISKTAKR